MKRPTFRSRSGFSILELIIGLFIGSLLLSTAYKANNYFTKSVTRENTKSIIQRDIISINNFIMKDIRMAGLSLPGNGIRAVLSANSNDLLQVFINDAGKRFSLTQSLKHNDSIVVVPDAQGAHANGWLCIAEDGIDTIYYQIYQVSDNTPGPDSIFLTKPISEFKTFTTSTGAAFPASRIEYYVDMVDGGLYRKKNGNNVRLAPALDVLKIVPKKAGGIVSANNAEVISIVIGAQLGSGSTLVTISDSMEVNIRN